MCGLRPCDLKVTCGLKAAMIFGKKPVSRGTGDREGERGKVQRPASSRARRTFWKGPLAEAGGQTARETEWRTRLPGRAKW